MEDVTKTPDYHLTQIIQIKEKDKYTNKAICRTLNSPLALFHNSLYIICYIFQT